MHHPFNIGFGILNAFAALSGFPIMWGRQSGWFIAGYYINAVLCAVNIALGVS